MKRYILFLLIVVLACHAGGARAQAIYTWTGASNSNFNTAANWSPSRTPASTDILVFNSNATVALNTTAANQTIGELRILSGTVTLANSNTTARTLVISNNFILSSGASLTINGTNSITTFNVNASNVVLDGALTLSGLDHRIIPSNSTLISFSSSSNFTQGAGCTGAPFGTASAGNLVRFSSGSTYHEQAASAQPFGLTAPAANVQFSSSSNYSHEVNAAPDLSGRTYGNFTIAAAGFTSTLNSSASNTIAGNFNVTTAGAFSMSGVGGLSINGSLNIQSGNTVTNTGTGALNIYGMVSLSSGSTFNNTSPAAFFVNGGFNVTGNSTLKMNPTAANLITITGDVNVNPGSTLQFIPSFASGFSTIDMAKGSGQTIGGGGTITLGARTQFKVSGANGLSLYNNLTVPNLLLDGGRMILFGFTLTLSGPLSSTNPALYNIRGGNGSGLIVNAALGSNLPFDQTLPGSTDKLATLNINSGPVTLGSNCTVSTALTLAAGTNKLVLNGNTLTLGGSFTGGSANSITGSATSGIVTTGTTGPLYLDPTTPGVTDALSTLTTSSGTATLATPCTIYGTLTASGGTLDLNAKSVTLKSNAAGTARLAAVTGTLNGATNVTVERYIPANASRQWRLLSAQSAPGTKTINQAWQEGATSLSQDPVPGYGTVLTCGNIYGYGTSEGYDAVSGGPSGSIYTYNATTNQFNVTPPNTNVKLLSSEQGYFVFVRGNRTSVPSNSTVTSTTLRNTGLLNSGSQTVSLGTNSFGLVGNPFASAIDFTQLTRTNVANKFWLWDPKLNTNGGYVLFDNAAGFAPSVPGGSFASANTVIPSGDAFFVAIAGGTGSVTIPESAKTASASNTGFRTAQTGSGLHLQLRTSDTTAIDGMFALFNAGYSDTVDADDAGKPENTGENMSLVRNGKPLALEARPEILSADTLFLSMWKMKAKNYQLHVDPNGFDPNAGITAFLHDRFRNTATPVDLAAPGKFLFDVSSDSGSYDRSRFFLTFRNSGATTAVSAPVATSVAGCAVFPNPVLRGQPIEVRFSNQQPGTCQVNLVNAQGQIIVSDRWKIGNAPSAFKLATDRAAITGSYYLELRMPGGSRRTIPVVIR